VEKRENKRSLKQFRKLSLLEFCQIREILLKSKDKKGFSFMEIWLDTSNVRLVQKAVRHGILCGVTTNPTIIAESGRSTEEVLEDLLHYQEGPVTAQVNAESTAEMVQQGKDLFSFSNRIIVKVPITKSGLEAIHLLSRQGIPTMATVLFSPRQALMASLAGADYLAPYLSRLEKAGEDPWQALQSMVRILANYRLTTKILGASINSVEQVIRCAEIGIYGITVKDEIFEWLVEDHPLTVQGVQKFAEDSKLLLTR
jgi:transaldolase